MAQPITTLPAPMTADEFIVWCEERPDESWELWDGVPVLKYSPHVPETLERHAHLRAKSRTDRAFAEAIEAGGLDCEALPDGVALKGEDGKVFKPDGIVRCGEEPPTDGEVYTPDPVIVFEVLSPSNTAAEMERKTAAYLAMPTVAHVLLIDTDARCVYHHTRADGAARRVERFGDDARLALDPPGLDISVTDLLPPQSKSKSTTTG